MTAFREETIFLSWFPFHGRSEGIARALGIPSYFVSSSSKPLPVRYFKQWRDTRRLLRDKSPRKIILMLPPTVALWSVRNYVRRSGAIIAGDLHTGAFDDPKWKWSIGATLRYLARHGLAIVTNSALASVAEREGCRAIVLDDLVEVRELDLSPWEDKALGDKLRNGYVLAPLAYAHDEPIGELLRAAEMTPDLTWVFTGHAPKSVRQSASSNVVFSGFVSNHDYVRLMSQAEVVLAITTNEDTMQRAGYEATSFARPLVTSDTRVLRDYYEGFAEICPPQAEALVEAVKRAHSDAGAASRMARLRAQKISEHKIAIRTLEEWIAG